MCPMHVGQDRNFLERQPVRLASPELLVQLEKVDLGSVVFFFPLFFIFMRV